VGFKGRDGDENLEGLGGRRSLGLQLPFPVSLCSRPHCDLWLHTLDVLWGAPCFCSQELCLLDPCAPQEAYHPIAKPKPGGRSPRKRDVDPEVSSVTAPGYG
jgi:hypothetical protein